MAQSKIGYVNFQEALGSIKDGKEVKKKLETFFKKKQAELKSEEEAILKERDALEKQSQTGMVKQEVLQQKAQELQKRMMALQEALMRGNQELALKEKEYAAPIIQKMELIIKDIARERGFDLVLERATILYGQDDLNLTDELIKRFNAAK